jgi:hypothetical protein
MQNNIGEIYIIMPSVPTTFQQAVDYEYERLNDKKKEVDAAISGQQRAIRLNDSYRKRFSRYTYMVIAVSLVLVLYLGIIALRKAVPSIPEWITDVILGLVLVGVFIYCILTIQEIYTRSILNYDELDLPPYVEMKTEKASDK